MHNLKTLFSKRTLTNVQKLTSLTARHILQEYSYLLLKNSQLEALDFALLDCSQTEHLLVIVSNFCEAIQRIQFKPETQKALNLTSLAKKLTQPMQGVLSNFLAQISDPDRIFNKCFNYVIFSPEATQVTNDCFQIFMRVLQSNKSIRSLDISNVALDLERLKLV